jgi:hypothetical protein
MSAVALGVGLGSLAHRGWHPRSHRCWCATAPAKLHKKALHQVAASQSQAPLVAATADAPCGFMQHFLCKIAYAGPGLSAVGAPRSVPALRAADCRPCWCAGVVAYVRRCARVFWSVACGQVSCVCPAHPLGLACFAASARGLPVRPQGAPCSTALGTRVKGRVPAGAARLLLV